MSGDGALWTQVLQAKYFPNRSVWNARPSAICTRLWREMLQNRAILVANTRWILGDGQTCSVFRQLWFRGWQNFLENGSDWPFEKVAGLFNFNSLVWNQTRLVQVCGEPMAQIIMKDLQDKVLHRGVADKIMFTWSRNGEFTTKKGYDMLVQVHPTYRITLTNEMQGLWCKIWKLKGIMPKIKIFFWKILNKALPTAFELSKHMKNLAPVCSLCEFADEDALHMLFFCSHAHAIWFLSPLGLCTSSLNGITIWEALTRIWQPLQSSQLSLFMLLAWHIWKSRCNYIFKKKQCNPHDTLRKALLDHLSLCPSAPNPANSFPQLTLATVTGTQAVDTRMGYLCCWIDGSFDESDKGGAAFVLMSDSTLVRYHLLFHNNATSPFHMEATALLKAIEAVAEMQATQCTFFSDCEILVRLMSSRGTSKSLQAADWRSYSELMQISNL